MQICLEQPHYILLFMELVLIVLLRFLWMLVPMST
uniref:Uncharacterized protein n=1 Tax=Arundo donax TaxID=35708 RepID=A0A0A8ZAM5_ARUDO